MWLRPISTGARWVFTLAGGGIAAAWGVSLWWEVGIDLVRGQADAIFWISDSDVSLNAWEDPEAEPQTPFSTTGVTFQRLGRPPWAIMPIRAHWIIQDDSCLINIPLWMPLALVTAPAACLWMREVRRRRSAKVGACARCGYDRRGLASPEALCPECGAVPTRTQ